MRRQRPRKTVSTPRPPGAWTRRRRGEAIHCAIRGLTLVLAIVVVVCLGRAAYLAPSWPSRQPAPSSANAGVTWYLRPPDPERSALDLALDWLVERQGPDGLWGEECTCWDCQYAGPREDRVRTSALVALAYLTAGGFNWLDHHDRRVRRGLGALATLQDDEGCIGPRSSPSFLLGHSVAAAALCHAYERTGSVRYRERARAAVSFSLRATDPYEGLRRGLDADAEARVDGWTVLMLRSAIWTDLAPDPWAAQQAIDWIARTSDPSTHRVRLLASIVAGEVPGLDAILYARALRLTRVAVDGGVRDTHGPEACFFGTLIACRSGSHVRDAWTHAVRRSILETQMWSHAGRSWRAWDDESCRVPTTALMCMTLAAISDP